MGASRKESEAIDKHNAAQMEKAAVQKALDFLDDFPKGYDAHKDGLSEPYDHREALNKLLGHARTLAFVAKRIIK